MHSHRFLLKHEQFQIEDVVFSCDLSLCLFNYFALFSRAKRLNLASEGHVTDGFSYDP